MPALFKLDVETDHPARRAVLRLYDQHDGFVAAHEVELAEHPPALWEGLFDTRNHVRRMAGVMPDEKQLVALGEFLGAHVLGPAIAGAVAGGLGSRTLLVRLPGDPDDKLAAAFARVPWEIARAPGDERTLAGRNVVVRAALAGMEPKQEASIEVAAGEAVRVLLVFAEAPGQRPLAARLERERLLDLFFDEVMPGRNVEVDVLCHGVTRRRIREAVRARGGYHVVHWSGHGNHNALQLALDAGEKAAPFVSGEEVAALLAGEGGFIPPVVFLQAGHSGSLVSVRDWASIRAAIGAREAESSGLDRMLSDPPGFTGTAFALVKAGVKQVVAMRSAVGDTYARRLARRVYRGMFADRVHHAVDTAVALARGELLRDARRAGEYAAVDHAAALVFGSEPVRLLPAARRSAQAGRRLPQPQPLVPGRDLEKPRGFVGRGEELTRLWREWIEAGDKPIAVVQGLAGLGKTSLAAEAVHLWFGGFDYVFAFQAKQAALGLEDFYRRVDQKLAKASMAYRERCQENERASVYSAASESFRGALREGVLRDNLVDALTHERVLLVLDNFETSLVGRPRADGAYACADPAWERLLETLAERLRGTGSRALVTTRHKPAALADRALWVPLGPLLVMEAALFFQNHAPLRELWYGDPSAKHLAKRILDVSRGHPLLMARIADLARAYYGAGTGLTDEGRAALGAALDRIAGEGFKTLPDLFSGVRSDRDRDDERRYLEDVAIGAVDLLVERLTPAARTLLWLVTRTGEPTTEDMIAAVHGAFPASLLGELCGAGLLVREGEASYAFHELVAERAAAWVARHPDERGGRTEAEVWTAYGERYGAAFNALLGSGKREMALEAGRRGIRYLVRARAFESLRGFAGAMVTSTNDPSLLGPVIADLQAVAGEVPAGEARWSLRTTLADALRLAGHPDQALRLYEQAVEEAEAAAQWAHLGTICQSWANALVLVGQLDRARQTFLRSADAKRRAGRPRVLIVASELEALRLDVMQGRAGEALAAIEEKLAEVRGWWARREKGEPVPEAPDGEDLARTLVGGLDIARQANRALERWQACLDLVAETESVERALGATEHELARTRFDAYSPLLGLGKLAEAKVVIEGSLDVFRRAEDVTMEAGALSALAEVWGDLGDPQQATALARRALALHERLPDPGNRAVSHNNLANYLHATGAPTEAGCHRLAALTYRLATGLDARVSLHNLAVDVHQAAVRNARYDLPRLADVLADPAFAPLHAFLADRGIPPADLQAAIDARVEQVRAAVAAAATKPPEPA